MNRSIKLSLSVDLRIGPGEVTGLCLHCGGSVSGYKCLGIYEQAFLRLPLGLPDVRERRMEVFRDT